MKKELVIYVDTSELEVEATVRSMSKNKDCVLITHEAGKFALNLNQLRDALTEILVFNEEHQEVTTTPQLKLGDCFEVEYAASEAGP